MTPGATLAERFVDEVTFLRMMKQIIPNANPALAGMDGTAISDRFMGGGLGRREQWSRAEDVGTAWEGVVDVAHRFVDGSIAIRIAASQRWEVWRSW